MFWTLVGRVLAVCGVILSCVLVWGILNYPEPIYWEIIGIQKKRMFLREVNDDGRI